MAEHIDRNGASALMPEDIAREIIQGTVEKSAVLSMGRKLPNMTTKQRSLNVLDSLPTAYWVDGDTGFKQTTKMQWDRKRIIAEELAVIVPIPEAVIDDVDYDIFGEIKPRIVEAMGKKIDEAILFGVNKPTSWRRSVVDSAVTIALPDYDDLYDAIMGEMGLISAVEMNGYDVNGFMANVAMRGKLRGLRDTTGQPLFKRDMQEATRYTLDGVPMSFPKNGAFNDEDTLMIAGDFEQLTYAFRQDITYKLLTEATIIDPETKQVLYSLAQQDMVALRCVMRLGWEIPNPISAFNASFHENATPFAVLTAESKGDSN